MCLHNLGCAKSEQRRDEQGQRTHQGSLSIRTVYASRSAAMRSSLSSSRISRIRSALTSAPITSIAGT